KSILRLFDTRLASFRAASNVIVAVAVFRPLTSALQFRNDGQRRMTKVLGHVLRRLYGVVHVFLEKCESKSQCKADDEPPRDILHFVRPNGAVRNLSAVNDADVRRFQSG